jgi:hypothetical protein
MLVNMLAKNYESSFSMSKEISSESEARKKKSGVDQTWVG